MPTCRAFACGCDVPIAGTYCDMCAEFTPICPCCGAVYGEHRLECTVPDGWTDSEEGPWDTEEDARTYGEAEVGVSWDVVRGGSGKWFVLTRDPEDEAEQNDYFRRMMDD